MTTVATETGRSESPSNDSPVIEVQDLVKTYGRDTRAVDGISFDVGPGELFGFLGPNGAGKTTTIRVLATLLRPTSGKAKVMGFDVERQPQDVRARLGIAMQMATLDAYSTGRETLELAGRLHRMPSKARRSRTDELLELIGLTGVAKKMTGTYSGGMKRRLDLASALMHRPALLILDEPTEGLDPQSRIALWEELGRISESGTTMLLTTHYMEEADRLCSRLAIIDEGRIVADGSPAALKATIGADTVVLDFEAAGEALERQQADVERLLNGIVEPDSVTKHAAGVNLAVENAGAAIPSMLRKLEGEGVHVAGLRMSQPNVDDVFLRYTGRHIREEAADQPMPMQGW